MMAATRAFVAGEFFPSSRNSLSRPMSSQNVSQNFCSSGAAAGGVAGVVGIEGGVVSGSSTSNRPTLVRRTGDHAMNSITRKSDSSQPAAETAVYLFDDWFDPIETGVRDRVREFIQAMVEGELDAALMRPRYGRRSQSSNSDAGGAGGVM